jgi:hypothetical protein
LNPPLIQSNASILTKLIVLQPEFAKSSRWRPVRASVIWGSITHLAVECHAGRQADQVACQYHEGDERCHLNQG